MYYVTLQLVQPTLGISKTKFISNYWYLKVIFVPQNLLWDTSSLKYFNLKTKEIWKCVRTIFFDIRWYFEISGFELATVNYTIRIEYIYLFRFLLVAIYTGYPETTNAKENNKRYKNQ